MVWYKGYFLLDFVWPVNHVAVEAVAKIIWAVLKLYAFISLCLYGPDVRAAWMKKTSLLSHVP